MLISCLVGKEINENPSWKNAVERASDWISQTLGQWYSTKNYAWRVLDGSERNPTFDLRIQAEDCTVADRFDLFEIANEKLFKSRIVALWGELSNQTIHAQAERLKRMSEEWQKEAPLVAD